MALEYGGEEETEVNIYTLFFPFFSKNKKATKPRTRRKHNVGVMEG